MSSETTISEWQTKTQKVRALLSQGDFGSALAIACRFRYGFTKDELRTLTIAHESMLGMSTLYEQLGIDVIREIDKSKAILQKKYTDLHIF